MVELMVKEKWCEPPVINRFHLSTLVQQIMSVITEAGGVMADRLHSLLVERGAFKSVDGRCSSKPFVTWDRRI